MADMQTLLTIIKRVRGDDINFLYGNLNEYSKRLLGECVCNLMYNTNNLKLTSNQLCRLRRKMSPYKKEFEYIAKQSGCDKRRGKAVKQIGGGLFASLAGILIPTIITLLNKNK